MWLVPQAVACYFAIRETFFLARNFSDKFPRIKYRYLKSNKKLEVIGYLDLKLENSLNGGEVFTLKWEKLKSLDYLLKGHFCDILFLTLFNLIFT